MIVIAIATQRVNRVYALQRVHIAPCTPCVWHWRVFFVGYVHCARFWQMLRACRPLCLRSAANAGCKQSLPTMFNFVASPSTDIEKDGQKVRRFVGTDDRTWTCTLFALEPKSNVSANFTTSAKRYYYSIKSSNVKQKAESQASLYDFANFFYFYIKKLLLFADCFDIVISACGSDSVVECHLAKVKVAGPNPVSRSTRKRIERSLVVVQHI